MLLAFDPWTRFTNPPLSIVIDDDCIMKLSSLIATDQESAYYLGSGRTSLAVLVIGRLKDDDKDQAYTIKMTQLRNNEDARGLEDSHIQNIFRKASSIFTRGYGWNVCRQIPKSWIPPEGQTREIDNENPFGFLLPSYYRSGTFPELYRILFIVDEFAGLTLDNRRLKEYLVQELTFEDIQGVFFDLIYGIMKAREIRPFSHNDLHVRNMTILRIEDGNTQRSHTIDDVEFIVQSPVQIKLIDFDHAVFDEVIPTSDLVSACNNARILIEMGNFEESQRVSFTAFVDRLRSARDLHFSDSVVHVQQFLLNDPLFQSMITGDPQEKRQKIHSCVQCRSRADYYDLADKSVFCSNVCLSRYYCGFNIREDLG